MSSITLSSDERFRINQTEAYLNGAKQFIIDSQQTFDLANRILHEINAQKKEIDEMRKKLKAPINQAGKAIEDFFRQPINFLTTAEQQYKIKLIKYKDAQDAKLRVSRTETMAQSEVLAEKAMEALKANDLEGYTNSLMEMGDLTNDNVAAINLDGLGMRDNWRGRVFDLTALIMAVADGNAPSDLLAVDYTKLNSLAKSVRDTMSYPGIEFYNDKIVSVKAAKV